MKPAIEQRLKDLFDGEIRYRGIEGGDGYAVGTTQGPVRSENQDRAFVAHIVQGGDKPRELLIGAIFDGMGGMREGGSAASSAAASFLATVATVEGPVAARLEAGAQSANAGVFAELEGRGGTTLTAVAFADPKIAHVIHVGDSRLYRSGEPTELGLVTEDQTIGGLVRGEAHQSDEDDLDNRLLQFVGIGEELQPSLQKVSDDDSSTWLLTTDGAHAFGRRNLLGVLRGHFTCHSIARQMIAGADAFGTDDNATVIALRPSEFRSRPQRFDGTTIAVWTSFANLELWLEPGPRVPIRPAPENPPAPPVDTLKSTPPKRAARAKSGRRARNKPTETPVTKANPDLFKITFGDAVGEEHDD
ncbi:PP2C family serine/threonine-protein phosphatase [Brevundimonas sp.]|uniref:PP2C family protein-serine/threonine phosphatase n=1 Tax=Brevundimonas sp. TaxID=1871086 RepID=UPI0035B1A2FE